MRVSKEIFNNLIAYIIEICNDVIFYPYFCYCCMGIYQFFLYDLDELTSQSLSNVIPTSTEFLITITFTILLLLIISI